MAVGRPSSVNLGLLAITILSLLLAAYGLLLAPNGNGRANSPRNGAASDSCDHSVHGRTGRCGGGTTGAGRRCDPAGPSSGAPSGRESKETTAKPEGRGEIGAKPGESPAKEAGVSADASGKISGIVLDSLGRPVEGAKVVARPADARPPSGGRRDFERELEELERQLQRLREQQRHAQTDADGRFTVDGLNTVLAYDLSASSRGGTARVTRVACGDEVTLLLSRECVLRGKVSHADGKPILSFRVRWFRADTPTELESQAVTSPDGRYEVLLAPGRQTVWVSLDGGEVSARQDLDVAEDGAEANFTFAGLATLSGTVKDNQQAPLPNVQLRLQLMEAESKAADPDSEGDPRAITVRTDSLGRYRFEALSPGRFSLKITFADRNESHEVEIAAGNNTQDYVLSSGARVTLRFRNSGGQMVTDVSVYFDRKGRRARPVALPPEEPGVRVFIGLEPGDYSIHYYGEGGAWSEHAAKLVEGDNQITLDIVAAAFLQGKVSGAGAPDNLTVMLRPETGKSNGNNHNAALVKADGSYRLGPMLPGNYIVELVSQGRHVVFSQPVKLGTGDTTQDLAIRDVASLTLTVSLPDGKPAAGARVSMTSGKAGFNARCDERGIAKLSYVPAGDCILWAESGAMRSQNYMLSLRSGEMELGLEVKATNCVRVTKVDKGSEAEKAGVQANDLLFLYNNREVSNRRTLDTLIKESKGTENVTLSVERNGQIVVLSIKGGSFGGSYQDAVR